MKISKLDQKFISSLFDEVVLETHKDNKYIGYNTLTNQDFRISINPIYSIDESEQVCENCDETCTCIAETFYTESILANRHCEQCLYIDCKVHL